MADHFTIIRNGCLVDLRRREAAPVDILIEGDRILSIGHAGMDAPPDARIVDASDRAMMPGLVNGHVHGHGTLAKGMVGDRWPLELFLNAMPGMTGGHRTLEDKYLNHMATVGSARAMGLGGKVGEIAPGFKADIVFLDLGHINYVPCHDMITHA
ncbi:MAG: 5-methylthioadenosine/S-adenosylhomocysteine deaminase, partial [Bradyrhizobium sp.]|nr:5-methylthioadenosine/S-adenosylhomocysteine deaminase [Bradyrhizobium sp.]